VSLLVLVCNLERLFLEEVLILVLTHEFLVKVEVLIAILFLFIEVSNLNLLTHHLPDLGCSGLLNYLLQAKISANNLSNINVSI